MLDTTVPGTHTIRYTAEKSEQVVTLELTVTVLDYVDRIAPVIEYNGDDPIVVEVGSTFHVPEISVTDDFDEAPVYSYVIKDASGNVVENVDTSQPGNFTITYTAQDKSGNTSEKIIALIVKAEKVSEETIEQINSLFEIA